MIKHEAAAFFRDFSRDDITVGGVPCRGIFEEQSGEVFGVVSGTTPALLVADTVVCRTGTEVRIGNRVFAVANPVPDGAGFIRLILEVE